MKIAFATQDDKTISAYFGQAPYYVAVQVVASQALAQEMRTNAHHLPA